MTLADVEKFKCARNRLKGPLARVQSDHDAWSYTNSSIGESYIVVHTTGWALEWGLGGAEPPNIRSFT